VVGLNTFTDNANLPNINIPQLLIGYIWIFKVTAVTRKWVKLKSDLLGWEIPEKPSYRKAKEEKPPRYHLYTCTPHPQNWTWGTYTAPEILHCLAPSLLDIVAKFGVWNKEISNNQVNFISESMMCRIYVITLTSHFRKPKRWTKTEDNLIVHVICRTPPSGYEPGTHGRFQ
jgi:hypothetical protein